jgi:hypothetical protein
MGRQVDCVWLVFCGWSAASAKRRYQRDRKRQGEKPDFDVYRKKQFQSNAMLPVSG